MGMRLVGPAPLRPLRPPLGSRPVSCVLRTLLAQGKAEAGVTDSRGSLAEQAAVRLQLELVRSDMHWDLGVLAFQPPARPGECSNMNKDGRPLRAPRAAWASAQPLT